MFHTIGKQIDANSIKAEIPLSRAAEKSRLTAVNTIKNILDGKDRRKLFILGPCSANDERAVLDYAERLARVAEEIKSHIFVVMRVYTAKPRTRGEGYMGIMHAVRNGDCADFIKGLSAARRMHIRVAEEFGLPTADEMLYPELIDCLSDTVGYVAVGARTSDDPTHRFVASGLDIPVGIKNPLNGNFADLIGSVHTAQTSNDFVFCGKQVRTDGNRHAHAVLRGAVDSRGNNKSNCSVEDIAVLREMFEESIFGSKAVIVDVGHSNSNKDPSVQPKLAERLFDAASDSEEFDSFFKGVMLESYIEDGNQPPNGGIYGKSVTDPCLGFEKTKALLYKVAEKTVV